MVDDSGMMPPPAVVAAAELLLLMSDDRHIAITILPTSYSATRSAKQTLANNSILLLLAYNY
jgi:hypothetical protein